MDINPETLKGEETRTILDRLISYVSKTEEELQEEKKEQKKKTTDLKLFIARKEGFELGTIEDQLRSIATEDSTHKYTVDFINDHGFSEVELNEEASLLEIRTPSYNRKDHSILINTDDYVRVYTTERRYWTKKTIEKVIDYLPGLSRLYLSADDIGGIVDGLNDVTETYVSGFTSKYQSYDDDRRISIQFHGGDEEDIKHIKEEFSAKPTRVEFGQKNSPTDVVTGAVTRDARVNIPGIKAGKEDIGAKTLDSVADNFEQKDQEHFNIPHAPEMSNGPGGIEIDGFTTIRLENVDQPGQTAMADGGSIHKNIPEDAFVTGLKEQILDKKKRYDFNDWGNDEFLVLDKERTETFHLGVSGKDLVVNARPETTAITVKEFCKIILEEFKSTYSISSRSTNLKE
ncbi:hypothetical protein JZX76_11435 [Haloarcula hispanica]|uniref:Uncharacterized protein n=1 Tax=Haloarcula hispanica TaxID=51589 RepID=A0A482T464_HALHI|nr:hypothetical protein [Haloarcula hispanica]MCJ0620099.1 hypothetical protein [Haloarcula hispanica]RYJ10531.1 hypothetical protein ELS20_11365 [Haloarcula hispanica]